MAKAGPTKKPNPKVNQLLAGLEPADFEALTRAGKIVPLKFRTRIQLQDVPIEAVYFPITCMFSLLVTSDGKAQMELATVGNEGVIGASELVQANHAMALHLVQIPGHALRIEAQAFAGLMKTRPSVLAIVQQHLYALLRQILYSAACNRLHSMDERCARWMLMTHDRAGQDTFPLTQEFLAKMLGVRRATVNLATGMLKKAGFIRYIRGMVTVVDRPGLESASCDCYSEILRAYRSLSKPSPPSA
jgi:CRP-like cAMP-binding protein